MIMKETTELRAHQVTVMSTEALCAGLYRITAQSLFCSGLPLRSKAFEAQQRMSAIGDAQQAGSRQRTRLGPAGPWR